jgi:hypothetical protein
MTTRNPITGDPIQTKPASDNYRENFDRIFRRTTAVMQAQQQLTDLAQGEGYGLCDKCDPDACCRL